METEKLREFFKEWAKEHGLLHKFALQLRGESASMMTWL